MKIWIYFSGVILLSAIILADGQKVDIAFVLDASGSVTDSHPPLWKAELKMVQKIMDNLNIGQDMVRVALVTFSNEATVLWKLDRYPDKRSAMDAIEALKDADITGDKTNIHEAMNVTQMEVFSGSPGDRPDVPDVVVIFTDAKPTLDVTRGATTAMDLRAAGLYLEVVALEDNPDRDRQRWSYFSSTGNVVDINRLNNQAVLSDFVARLRNMPAQSPIVDNPCRSSPCKNGGECLSGEDPYGWGFYCYCRDQRSFFDGRFVKIGGRLCQMVDPCRTCPSNTKICARSISSDKCRYCYGSNFMQLD